MQELEVHGGEPLARFEAAHEVPAMPSALSEGRENVLIVFEFFIGIEIRVDGRVVDGVQEEGGDTDFMDTTH